MFSSRLEWHLPSNRLYALRRAKRESGTPILDLTESNPTRVGLAYPVTEIAAALGRSPSLDYDPSPAGSRPAREAIAAYYASRGLRVEPYRIFLTASTSESYAFLFKLLADPGDEILLPRPSYPLFEFLARLESVRGVSYPLTYADGWSLDVDELARRVTARTRAVVLVNPNNPTGSFVKSGELTELVALCADRRLAIISDEVFSDYRSEATPDQVPSLTAVPSHLTFCLSGLSKVLGLPQMKLGWLVLAGPAADRLQAARRLELIADTYLSVGGPVQSAAPRLLALHGEMREQISRRVHENLSALRALFNGGTPCRLLRMEGGWFALLQVPRTRSEEEWALTLLDRYDVLVQPGYFYDFDSEAFLVMSLLPPPTVFREGIGRLLSLVLAA